MDLFADVLSEAVVDTLKLVPFLLVTYLLMEALEHSAGHRVQEAVERSGKAGPVVGALLGALPQCGFSAMAATLYSGGVITVGTLVAVILSTSDEMVPVFLAHQASIFQLGEILAFKALVGLVVGVAVDGALRARRLVPGEGPHIHDLCQRAHCHCDEGCGCHGSSHGHGSSRWFILRSAAIHTAQVSFFILVVTLASGLVIEMVGQEALGTLLANHPIRATFLTALVGLIPNCGASVAITELYLDGVLATGPMVAGLLSSGGVGLLVLWRTNADMRKNLLLTVFVYAVGVAVGLLVGSLGILF